MTLATWITSQDNYCCLENEPFTRIESVVWQVLLRCVTSQKRTSIFRECLQLRPPMTTPWPLVEPVALPLHLRLDRFVHLINFTLSLFFRCLFSKLCSQMYPGLPGKEGAPPPPASYPAPQVCERTFMLLRKLLLLLLLVCLKIFASIEKKNVNDKLCSPAAPGSSPGGDSGKSRSSSRA